MPGAANTLGGGGPTDFSNPLTAADSGLSYLSAGHTALNYGAKGLQHAGKAVNVAPVTAAAGTTLKALGKIATPATYASHAVNLGGTLFTGEDGVSADVGKNVMYNGRKFNAESEGRSLYGQVGAGVSNPYTAISGAGVAATDLAKAQGDLKDRTAELEWGKQRLADARWRKADPTGFAIDKAQAPGASLQTSMPTQVAAPIDLKPTTSIFDKSGSVECIPGRLRERRGEKQSAVDPQLLKQIAGGIGVGVAGLGADYAANAWTRGRSDRFARLLHPMTPEERKALNDQAPDTWVSSMTGMGRTPFHIGARDLERGLGIPRGSDPSMRRGLVMYDPETTPASYYAHELAHGQTPTWAQTDSMPPAALAAANVASYLPGAAYGAATGNVGRAALIGMASRLIARSPRILEEYFAMRRAKQMIDRMPVDDKGRQMHRDALSRAFLTYVIPPAIGGAAMGAAGAGARRMM